MSDSTGTSRRRVIALGAVAKASSFPGQSYWISGFVDPLIMATGLSRATISAAYACATVVSAATSTRMGVLTDRKGVVTGWIVAATGVVGGTLMLSAAGKVGPAGSFVMAVIALGVVRSFGQGSMPVVGTLAVIRGMPHPRGKAMAITNSVHSATAAVMPLLAALGIAFLGWRETLIACAIIMAVVVTLSILAARTLPELSQPATGARRARKDQAPLGKRGWALMYLLGLPPMTITAIVFHASQIGRQSDASIFVVASAIAAMSVIGIIGAGISGRVVDTRGLRSLLILLTVTVSLAPLVLSALTLPMFIIGFAIAGICSGVSAVSSSVAWSLTFGDDEIGRFQGLGAAGVIGGASIGPLIPGLADSAGFGLPAAMLVLASAGLCGAVLALFWPERPAVTGSN